MVVLAQATLALAADLIEARLPRTAALLLMAPSLVRVDLPLDASAPPGEIEGAQLDRLKRERAKLVLRVVDGVGELEKLDEATRGRIDGLLVATANGIQAIAAESPALLVELGRAQVAAGQNEQASRVLDVFLKQYGKDAPAPRVALARRLLAQAYGRSGKAADGARTLEGVADVDAQLLRGQLLVEASAFTEAEKVFRALLDGGTMSGDAARREQAQLGWAEAMLLQGKLVDAARLLDGLPVLTDKAASDKMLNLRQELKARQEQAKKNGDSGQNGQPANGSRPAQPPNGK
jgi:hypothetical protein